MARPIGTNEIHGFYKSEEVCYSCFLLRPLAYFAPSSIRKRDFICRDCRNCKAVLAYSLNPTPRKEYQKRLYQKYRNLVLAGYSPLLSCACCGDNRLPLLELDHIDGLGPEGRVDSFTLFRRLVRENFPPGYQVLCAACNITKAHGLPCLHGAK